MTDAWDGPGYQVRRRDGIARVILSAPERRNSFTWPFWAAFRDDVLRLDQDGATRVLIVEAQGQHFSAGMDFSFFQCSERPDGMEEARYREMIHSCILHLNAAIDAMEHVRFPVMAAVQGACIGAALDLVCAATLRYGTQDSHFVAAEVTAGLAPDMGTLQRLPHLMPAGVANELLLTGRPLEADEAHDHGFLSAVLPDKAALDAKVMQIAAQISSKSPVAVSGIKRNLLVSRDDGLRAGKAHIAAWNAAHFPSADIAASLSAMRSGTQPDYENLASKEVDWLFADTPSKRAKRP